MRQVFCQRRSFALLFLFELGEFLFLGGFGGGLLVLLAGVSGFHGDGL